jgi:DNA-binding HxlR family transcriptional regulator
MGATLPQQGEFDFQTHFWHGGHVTSTPASSLAELPGRPCPIAAALELVGERWALLVVREIALGANHFGAIVRGTGAPRDRIAARLKALESAGVVVRSLYQNSPPRHEYRLTPSGEALIPVLDALLEWGKVHAVSPDDPDRQRRYPPFSKLKESR